MSVCERRQHIPKNPNDIVDGQRSISRDARLERLTLDQWHRVIRQAYRVARCQHRNNVRVLKLRSDLNLPSETLEVYRGSKIRRENLDHNLPLESSVLGDEHSRHPTAAELTRESVGSAKRLLELFPQTWQTHAPSSLVWRPDLRASLIAEARAASESGIADRYGLDRRTECGKRRDR